MKTMKHVRKLATVLTAATLFISCTVDNLDIPEIPEPVDGSKVVTLKVTLPSKSGTATKALTENGNTITASWAKDDEILVMYTKTDGSIYNYIKATVTGVDADGRATITMELTDPKDNTTIQFGYPYSYYYGEAPDQDGTLETIAAHYDTARGEGLLRVDGDVASIDGNIVMRNTAFIWKFSSITDGTNSLISKMRTISIGVELGEGIVYHIGDATLSSPDPSKPVYIAAPALESVVSLTGIKIYIMSDISGDEKGTVYFTSKSGVTMEMGKFYSTPQLALRQVRIGDAPKDHQPPYRGWTIAADGTLYKDALSASEDYKDPVGMVVYWGEPGTADASSDTYCGLAMALDYFPTTDRAVIKWCSDATHTCLTPCTTFAAAKADIAGIANTAALLDADHLSDGHSHPAAQAVADYSVVTPPGASGWFLPACGQLYKAMSSYWNSIVSVSDFGKTNLNLESVLFFLVQYRI